MNVTYAVLSTGVRDEAQGIRSLHTLMNMCDHAFFRIEDTWNTNTLQNSLPPGKFTMVRPKAPPPYHRDKQVERFSQYGPDFMKGSRLSLYKDLSIVYEPRPADAVLFLGISNEPYIRALIQILGYARIPTFDIATAPFVVNEHYLQYQQ